MDISKVILDAVARSGLSERQVSIKAFGHDTGIRDIKRSGSLTTNRLAKLCEVLDLEFELRPAGSTAGQSTGFSEPVSVFQLHEPEGVDEWSTMDTLPGPSPFVFQPDFDLMGEIKAGTYCLVDPHTDVEPGDLVYLQNQNGEVNLGRYHGKNDKGWPIVHSHKGMMVSEWNPATLDRIHPITWTGRTPPPTFIVAPCTDNPEPKDILNDIAKIEASLSALRKRIK